MGHNRAGQFEQKQARPAVVPVTTRRGRFGPSRTFPALSIWGRGGRTIGCWLLDVGCWMLDVNYWLFIKTQPIPPRFHPEPFSLWTADCGLWTPAWTLDTFPAILTKQMPSVFIKTYGCQMNERD